MIVPGASLAPSGRSPQVTVAPAASAFTGSPSIVSVSGGVPPVIVHVTGFRVPAVHSERPAVSVSARGSTPAGRADGSGAGTGGTMMYVPTADAIAPVSSVTWASIVSGIGRPSARSPPQGAVTAPSPAATGSLATVSVYGGVPPMIVQVTGVEPPVVHSARSTDSVSCNGAAVPACVLTGTPTPSETMSECVTQTA